MCRLRKRQLIFEFDKLEGSLAVGDTQSGGGGCLSGVEHRFVWSLCKASDWPERID